MADVTKYGDYGLDLNGAAAPFERGSLVVGNDVVTDRIRSGAAMTDDLIQVVVKQPMIRASLLDPSLVTAWAALGTGGLKATFRAYEQNGGFGAGYKSYQLANGIIMPVSLQANVLQRATLEILAMGTFTTGTGMTVGTGSTTPADVTKAYYPTSITVGSDTITALTSVNANWQYGTQHDDQLEPSYYYYDNYTMQGNAMVKDVAMVTAARLEDGTSEAVTVLLTDANNGSNTVSVSLGTCKVFATVQGDMANIQFEKLAA